MIKKKKATQKM